MDKIFFVKLSKKIVKPLYYIIHYNFFFGLLQKYFFKNFKFRKFTFNINYQRISIPYASSFLFKTYEYNDRILIEKHISKKNKCIVIGGGIGFIPCLSYHKSKNKLIISEIDESITPLLNSNLKNNKCDFLLIEGNLIIYKENDYENFYISKNFIANSRFNLNSFVEKKKVKNYLLKDLKDFSDFNTLIIDGEGIEEHFLTNLNLISHIKYLIFELHEELLDNIKIKKIFSNLSKNKFILKDNCFNSFYFRKNE